MIAVQYFSSPLPEDAEAYWLSRLVSDFYFVDPQRFPESVHPSNSVIALSKNAGGVKELYAVCVADNNEAEARESDSTEKTKRLLNSIERALITLMRTYKYKKLGLTYCYFAGRRLSLEYIAAFTKLSEKKIAALQQMQEAGLTQQEYLTVFAEVQMMLDNVYSPMQFQALEDGFSRSQVIALNDSQICILFLLRAQGYCEVVVQACAVQLKQQPSFNSLDHEIVFAGFLKNRENPLKILEKLNGITDWQANAIHKHPKTLTDVHVRGLEAQPLYAVSLVTEQMSSICCADLRIDVGLVLANQLRQFEDLECISTREQAAALVQYIVNQIKMALPPPVVLERPRSECQAVLEKIIAEGLRILKDFSIFYLKGLNMGLASDLLDGQTACAMQTLMALKQQFALTDTELKGIAQELRGEGWIGNNWYATDEQRQAFLDAFALHTASKKFIARMALSKVSSLFICAPHAHTEKKCIKMREIACEIVATLKTEYDARPPAAQSDWDLLSTSARSFSVTNK